jgi:hypothetical protein
MDLFFRFVLAASRHDGKILELLELWRRPNIVFVVAGNQGLHMGSVLYAVRSKTFGKSGYPL